MSLKKLPKTVATLFLILFFSVSVYSQTIQDGLTALRNEQPQKAKNIFLKIVAGNPVDAEANYRLGNLYYAMGIRDSASFYFQKGTRPEDKVNYNFAGFGKLALDEKNDTKAQEYFNKLINNGKSRDPKAYIFVADAWFNSSRKDANRALPMLEKATALELRNAEAQLLLADAHMAMNNAGKAVTSYEYAIEGDPKLAYAYMKIGQIYMNARNYEEAHKFFKKGHQADMDFIPLYRELAEFNFYAKNYKEAANLQKQYIDKTSRSLENLTKYAKYLFMNKDYDNTVNTIKEVMQMDSSDVIMSRLIGYSAFEEGKYEEGLAFMERFFQTADTSKIIGSDYAYYGKLLSKTGNDSLAIINLNKAIEVDPENTDLFNDLALALYAQKKYLESAAVYEQMMQLKTGTSQDYFQLAKAYYYGGDFAKADTAFIKITQMQPALPVGYLWRARCNAQLDPESDKGLALPHYQKFAELAASEEEKYKRDLVEANSYFGYYFAFINENKTEAKAAWTKVQQLDPENLKAKEFFKELSNPAKN